MITTEMKNDLQEYDKAMKYLDLKGVPRFADGTVGARYTLEERIYMLLENKKKPKEEEEITLEAMYAIGKTALDNFQIELDKAVDIKFTLEEITDEDRLDEIKIRKLTRAYDKVRELSYDLKRFILGDTSNLSNKIYKGGSK